MSKFVVAGVTHIETIVKVDRIPIEYAPLTQAPHTIFTSAGGDAYNESLALKWLGDEVDFVSVIGENEDTGFLNPPGRGVTLDLDYVLPVLKETPAAVVLYDEERRQQHYEDNKDIRDAVYDISLFEKAVAGCDMIVTANANFCRPFIEVAKKNDKKMALNLRNFSREKEQYSTDFLSAADILYFSDDNLDEDPYEFIRSIEQDYHPEIVILGQGAEGLIISDRKADIIAHYNTVKTAEVLNTVGAGNALFSCFLHYYLENGDSVYAIKNALLFASYKIGFMGTSNGFMTVDQLQQWRGIIWDFRK